jgi:hypothetical protein
MSQAWRDLVEAAPRVFPDDLAFLRYDVERAFVNTFEPWIKPDPEGDPQ